MKKRQRWVNAPSTEELIWRVRARMGRILEGLEARDKDNPDPPRRRRWPRRVTGDDAD